MTIETATELIFLTGLLCMHPLFRRTGMQSFQELSYKTSLVSLSFKPRPKTGLRRWIPVRTRYDAE